jgi:proteasome lid subunit RPN8/RPN11
MGGLDFGQSYGHHSFVVRHLRLLLVEGPMNAPPPDIEESKNLIRAHAERCAPYECCGLIIKAGNKQDVICARNIAKDPRHAFLLHPDDYVAAEEAGDVLALYHSHVEESPEPSMADKVLAERHNLPVIIVSWPSDNWTIYTPAGFKAELEGRPFVYGVLDCLTIVQDYFRDKHGIEIPAFQYTEDWWNRGEDLYRDNLPKQGFVLVHDEPRPSDLILMQCDGKVPNHCAIYVGDGMMLHHAPGHLSGYHPYICERGYYALCTVGIWRHKKLIERGGGDAPSSSTSQVTQTTSDAAPTVQSASAAEAVAAVMAAQIGYRGTAASGGTPA